MFLVTVNILTSSSLTAKRIYIISWSVYLIVEEEVGEPF